MTRGNCESFTIRTYNSEGLVPGSSGGSADFFLSTGPDAPRPRVYSGVEGTTSCKGEIWSLFHCEALASRGLLLLYPPSRVPGGGSLVSMAWQVRVAVPGFEPGLLPLYLPSGGSLGVIARSPSVKFVQGLPIALRSRCSGPNSFGCASLQRRR